MTDNDDDNDSSSQSNDEDDSLSSPPFVRVEVIEEVEPASENESTVVDVIDTTPVASASTTLDNIGDETNDRYANVVVPVVEWNNRLQDMGCTKDELKIK